MANTKSVILKIKRQLTPDAKPSWEEFEIPYKPNMNITSALMEIAANPVTRDGKQTTPITYDSELSRRGLRLLRHAHQRTRPHGLLRPDRPTRKAHQARAVLEISRMRDLSVDRSVLFENLKKVKAWIPIDGTYDLGSGPRMSARNRKKPIRSRSCISCCCCMEACPQFNEDTGFVGAATISQVRLFNTHPTGQALKRERLSALMGDGGIQECGYAQNCVEICPKDIPLTTSIAEVGGQVMKQALGDLFRK